MSLGYIGTMWDGLGGVTSNLSPLVTNLSPLATNLSPLATNIYDAKIQFCFEFSNQVDEKEKIRAKNNKVSERYVNSSQP